MSGHLWIPSNISAKTSGIPSRWKLLHSRGHKRVLQGHSDIDLWLQFIKFKRNSTLIQVEGAFSPWVMSLMCLYECDSLNMIWLVLDHAAVVTCMDGPGTQPLREQGRLLILLMMAASSTLNLSLEPVTCFGRGQTIPRREVACADCHRTKRHHYPACSE